MCIRRDWPYRAEPPPPKENREQLMRERKINFEKQDQDKQRQVTNS